MFIDIWKFTVKHQKLWIPSEAFVIIELYSIICLLSKCPINKSPLAIIVVVNFRQNIYIASGSDANRICWLVERMKPLLWEKTSCAGLFFCLLFNTCPQCLRVFPEYERNQPKEFSVSIFWILIFIRLYY